MNKARIGIIGAGSIVEVNHIPAIRSLERATMAWVFDKNPQRTELVAKMYGIPVLSGEFPAAALEQVDICLLAIPYGARKPYIDLCRKIGKCLVVEKPFAFSKEEHLDYCSGFQPWEIAVNFQRRYYHSVGMISQIIGKNRFGRLRSVDLVQGNFSLKGGSGYLSDVGLAGGGVIAESASHILDILLLVTRAERVKLSQLQSLHLSGLDYDTAFESVIETASDEIRVHCEISTLRNLRNGLYLEFDHAFVSCDLSPEGKIFLRDKKDQHLEFSLLDESREEVSSFQATKVNMAFFLFWQQLLDAVLEKKPNSTSACTSLLTSSWIGEIYKKINRS